MSDPTPPDRPGRRPNDPDRDGLAADERGVSAVLGAVLMFGLVMAALVMIQVTAVPVWNQGVEFQHSNRVEGELGELHDDTLRIASLGGSYSTTVELGATYPTRPFLISPPDPSGHLRTTAAADLTVRGARAPGEAGDYWDGSAVTYDTRSLVYRADYNELRGAPQYVIENSAMYERYDESDATLGIAAPTIVDDRTVNLILLNGSLSRAGTRPATITAHDVSAPAETTMVRNAAQPITLTVPTLAGAGYWEKVLAPERTENGGHITEIAVTEGDPYNELTVRLEPGVDYRLRVAKVGIGTDRERGTPHYLTLGGGDPTLDANEPEEFEFVVRDRYNNPVGGVRVDASLDGPGTLEPVDPVSDADGTVTFRYVSGAAGRASIEATFGPSPDALSTATREVRVVSTGGGGGPTTGCPTDAWSPSDTTRTFAGADQNCVWSGIESASSLELLNPRFTPLKGNHDDVDTGAQYFRLTFAVTDGETTYLVEVTDATDGLKRSLGGGWSNRRVEIHRRVGDTGYTTVASVDLAVGVLEPWYQGSDSVDLLSPQSYDKPQGIDELRKFMRQNQVEIYVVEMDGRVTIRAT